MPITATVQGFLQISGYDSVGWNAPLVLPQKQRSAQPPGHYRNAGLMLGVQVPEELHKFLRVDAVTLPDNAHAGHVYAAAKGYLANVMPTADGELWDADPVADDHAGTPTGWGTILPGQRGYLYELKVSTNSGTSWKTYEMFPHTADASFGGEALVQPVLAIHWSA
ncbi:MAG: hypothetical protein AAF682_06215 [Planctomycetota bacterium]